MKKSSVLLSFAITIATVFTTSGCAMQERKLRPRPKCQEQPKPQLQLGKKQRLLTKKQENRSANF